MIDLNEIQQLKENHQHILNLNINEVISDLELCHNQLMSFWSLGELVDSIQFDLYNNNIFNAQRKLDKMRRLISRYC